MVPFHVQMFTNFTRTGFINQFSRVTNLVINFARLRTETMAIMNQTSEFDLTIAASDLLLECWWGDL